MNRVIALAWAVEPLAFNDCLPPQTTFVDSAYGGTAFVATACRKHQHAGGQQAECSTKSVEHHPPSNSRGDE